MEKDRKYIIIALVAVILALVAGIGYMMFFNHTVEYQTIALSNGTTVEVPKVNDSTWTVNALGIRAYSAPSEKTMMTSFNSAEAANPTGAKVFSAIKEKMFSGSSSVEKYNKRDIKENTINGTHYYMVDISNNKTQDNVILCSENIDILKHMIDSLTFGNPNAANVDMVSPTSVSDNGENTYSEDELMMAILGGYYYGYLNGYSDSYDSNGYDSSYDDYSYDDYDSGSSSYSGYDDYDDPCRDPFKFHETYERRTDKELVRQRIHELSEVGDHVHFPGYLSVQEISQRSDYKYRERYPLTAFPAYVRHQEKDEERYQQHSKQSQFISKVHYISLRSDRIHHFR